MYRYASASRWNPRPQRPMLLRQEIFTGMRDSYDASAGAKNKAQLLQNVYPQDAEVGGGLVGRPGFRALTTSLGGAVRGQRSYQFTKLDGTELTLFWAGGAMYSVNWSTRTVSAVSLGALVLNTTAHIAAVTFADSLILSDGIHKPIRGTYAAGAWTFVELANCPVLYGQPVVHYAKLVGIKAAERSTIVWSEENDPTTGYEAGGYNNAWTLGQTDQEPLYALGATNEALYYWRAYSIGAIYGAVSAEWSTTGVQDSVSTTVGTVSPWAVVQHESSFFFPDADARVQRMIIGGGLQDPAPWLDSRETTRNIPRSMLGEVVGASWTAPNLVLLAFPRLSGEAPEIVLTFAANTGIFTGTWRVRGGVLRTLDVVKNGDGQPTLMHLNDTGAAYDWGHPQGTVWSDAGVAIEHIVYGTAMGWDHAVQKRFVRLDVNLRLTSALTDLKVNYLTPRGQSSEISVSGTGSFPLWDVAVWDSSLWAGDTQESHVPVGLLAEGRWIQVRLRHAGLDEQFGLLGWTVEAYPMGAIPTAP